MAYQSPIFPFSDSERLRHSLLWCIMACIVSLLLYLGVFAVVRKPITIGVYREMIKLKLGDFIQSPPPRVLILAGSNARVSHKANVLEKELRIPVTNGGLSADTSLQFTIGVFENQLKPGDVIYLPLEYQSYLVDDRTSKVDYFYLASYGRNQLKDVPLEEALRALFIYDLSYLAAACGEMLLFHGNLARPNRGNLNEDGDQLNHGTREAERFREVIENWKPRGMPTAPAIKSRPLTIRQLENFLQRCTQRGVRVFGGLPTIFDDIEVAPDLIKEIRDIYERNNHQFLILENKSQYPRTAFFDSQYHLSEPAAVAHSESVARALKSQLKLQ